LKTTFLFFLVGFFLWGDAFAAEVAFLRGRERDGSYVELEKGGMYAHVAIRYGNGWLQAIPMGGVVLTPGFGSEWIEPVLLVNEAEPEPSQENVLRFLHKPYDGRYNWSDAAIYCSELVGKLLHLVPEPMRFDGQHWRSRGDLPWGEPGLSPDGIFRRLINSGWKIRFPN
jgi:hypothetical protein